MYVLGTAGHIDHGKSLLIRSMTGIDPDRLRQEKERGMTLDLGFAWLKLPSGREVGIVDVPGHERFVKNMLAGVGGIDLALLIVAASEGVMPQTREHLAILDLIGVNHGVVVITKKDLVDGEMLELVRMEVEEIIAPTTLAGSPVVPVSSVTGDGIPELLGVIDAMLEKTEPRHDLGRPRLPVDRVFTMSGSGTVVTGTLIDGSFSVGQEVEIVPSGRKTRIRGLQTHKSKLETAGPGSRVAANLTGVNTSEIKRGSVITKPGWLVPAHMVTARLKLIKYLQRPVRHGLTVSFHTGAAETMAKLRLLETDSLEPGASGWVQIVLEEPVAVVKGDRYIIRSTMETLGGGPVVDARTRRLRRKRPEVIANLEARESGGPEDLVMALLESKQPLERTALISQANLPSDTATEAINSLLGDGTIVAIGEKGAERLFTFAGWTGIENNITGILAEYHRKFPLRPGMPKVEISGRLKMGNRAGAALAKVASSGVVVEDGLLVRLPSHEVVVTPAQRAAMDSFIASLRETPFTPPPGDSLEPDLIALLAAEGTVVKLTDTIVFLKVTYETMIERVKTRIRKNGKVSLGEVRDMFGASRKYAQALLDNLDSRKITRRVGDDRVLY